MASIQKEITHHQNRARELRKKSDEIAATYVRQTQRMDSQRRDLLKTENRFQKVGINKTTGEKRGLETMLRCLNDDPKNMGNNVAEPPTGYEKKKVDALEQIRKQLQSLESPPKTGKGIHLQSLVNWDPRTLSDPIPLLEPEFMGSGWFDEVHHFDSSTIPKRGLLMDTKQDIITFITEELYIRISSWDDYNIALKHIARKTEAAGVTLGAFLAQDPTTFECVKWRRMCGAAGSHDREPNFTSKRSKLYYYAKLRAAEVVRGVDAQLNNCATLFANQSLRQCIRVLSEELLLSRLWWLYNLDTPVSRLAFSEAN